VKLPKAARLRRRCEYLAVQERGGRLFSGEVLVLFRGVAAGRPRIGITVSSKVANAVGRNQLKRWVRQAFRELQDELPPVDLVVIARSGALALGQAGIRKALRLAAKKLATLPAPAAPSPAPAPGGAQ
jgi:ribonuclease P protein component